MGLKNDQERVLSLLKDTITLLCKNGLTFKSKFAIDAVIGVTVDENELFYLSMNEIVKSDTAPAEPSGKSQGEHSDNDAQFSGDESKSASERKRRKRKRQNIKQEESCSDGENGYQSEDVAGDASDRSRLDESSSELPSPVKKPSVKVESAANDEEEDIVFIKQELDESWSHSSAHGGDTNSSYQSYPNTSMSQSDFSHQDPNFPSLSDVNLVPMGSANDSAMWSQNLGVSPGQARPFRPRGPRSFTATTPGQQPGDDSQQSNQDSQQALAGNRSFTCSMCGKNCISKSALVAHENGHKGKYNYYCSFCGRGYMATSDLRGHIASHTGVREFKCLYCGREYSYKGDLKKHLSVVHKLQQPVLRKRKQ